MKDEDSSIREMADEELKQKNKKIILIEMTLVKLLLPKDRNDEKNSILEKMENLQRCL